jgi:hypothetical protein
MLGGMRYPKPEEWIGLAEEFRSSGLQQKEFCAKQDISLNSFRYWFYKMASKSSPTRVQRFVPVEVVASPASKTRVAERVAALIEAGVPSGVVIRFVVGTDTRYLAELLAAIG